MTNLDFALPIDWAIGRNLATLSDYLTYAIQLDQSQNDIAGTEITFDGSLIDSEFGSLADYLGISEPKSEAPTEFTLKITNTSQFVQRLDLISNDPTRINFSNASFDLGIGESRYVSLFSTAPYGAGQDYEVAIHSRGYNDAVRFLPIFVQPATLSVTGDVDNDGELTFIDLLRMVRILYRDEPILTPIRQIDATCDFRFSLTDLMFFVNYLYLQAPLPCGSAQ